MRAPSLIACCAIALVGTARADNTTPADLPPPPPPTYRANSVEVVEKLGGQVPLDARFDTHDGKSVRLGDVLAGDLPTILTFNYSDCPQLCNQQLNGLVKALPELAIPRKGFGPEADRDMAFKMGTQFRVVSISLEPNDSVARLTKMRDRYIERVVQSPSLKDTADTARAGWTFLRGDKEEVARVADAVGFRYTYLEDREEWAHPAALILLSSRGVVTRYVGGIAFEDDVLRESIVKAGLAEPATASGFIFRCYHWDPDANDHSNAGVVALRIGAAGFLILLVTGLGVLHLTRRASTKGAS
ncbi:MAG: SCO family protein [Deltaproteobacteria bacterium]|nr:SCO family protein [Deltaproteobacteria bacterium]